jgi:hypothetical protein
VVCCVPVAARGVPGRDDLGQAVCRVPDERLACHQEQYPVRPGLVHGPPAPGLDGSSRFVVNVLP